MCAAPEVDSRAAPAGKKKAPPQGSASKVPVVGQNTPEMPGNVLLRLLFQNRTSLHLTGLDRVRSRPVGLSRIG
jgi:hypothetical protein